MSPRRLRARSIALFISLLTVGGPAAAFAQTLGTFPWQVAPYCNVVTFTVSVDGAGFRLTGFDNQCGGAQLPAAGAVTLRSDGQYGLSFYVVTPTGLTSHVTAVLSPASISGPWHDSSGNAGTLAFNPVAPAAGAPRPAPVVSNALLADGAVTLAKLAAGAVDSARLADGAVSTVDLADAAVTSDKVSLPFVRNRTTAGAAFSITNDHNNGIGVRGATNSGGGTGVLGVTDGLSGQGVVGISANGSGIAVLGRTESGSTGNAGRFENSESSNTADVLVVVGGGTGELIQAGQAANTRFRVHSNGNVTADGTFTGGGADVAEFIDAVDTLDAGDVVEIDTERAGQFRRAATAVSSAVAGVITTKPGLLMNATDIREKLTDGPALALAGRVPVKVCAENGAIAPGDLLVSSSVPGHAMKAPAAAAQGTVIGKALGVLAGGTGVIEMLVMLR